MASAESGNGSNLISPGGEGPFATPATTGNARIEMPAIEDVDESHLFADSCIIIIKYDSIACACHDRLVGVEE